MSHYTVLAIIRKGSEKSLDALLAPYSEGKKVEPYVAKTKSQLIAEKVAEIEKYRRSHEAAASMTEDEYRKAAAERNLYGNYGRMKDAMPEEYASVDLSDEGAVFELVEKEYEDELNGDGDLISTYNPQSKWDWYEIGGRWKGRLRMKNGYPVDSAPAGLVDWDAMFSPKVSAVAKNREFWDEYVLGKVPGGVEKENYLREKYPYEFYRPEYYLKRYGTKGEYIRRLSLWATHAVVDEKGWHEPGRMGWFGCSNATPESERDWEDNYRSRFIDTLDPDDRVILVDCHI